MVEILSWSFNAGSPGGSLNADGAFPAEAGRRATSVALSPRLYKDHVRAVEDARAELDDAAFSASWAEGSAMNLEQAAEFALNDSSGDSASTP